MHHLYKNNTLFGFIPSGIKSVFWLDGERVKERGKKRGVLWVCDFVAAVGLMLLKSSHHWKVISNTKVNPGPSVVKGKRERG